MTADLSEIEQQLLIAAAVHGLGPAADLSRACTARVVDQVLRWRGLTVERMQVGWPDGERDPEHEMVYAALVRMTHQKCPDGSFRPAERAGPVLFEGGGNWGVPGDPTCPPCQPEFNSCRLTAEGEQQARLLLEQHPEYCKGSIEG